jgi:hypothetical protein
MRMHDMYVRCVYFFSVSNNACMCALRDMVINEV